MLYAFRLCILLFIQLTCFFAENLKQEIETDFPSSIRLYHWRKSSIVVPSGKAFLLLAHLSLFLTQNQIVFKNLNDFCYF